MEKQRGAPRVAHFAGAVDGGSVGDGNFHLFEVVAEQRTGDFGVGAYGVSAKRSAVVAQGELDVVENADGVFAVCGDDWLYRRNRVFEVARRRRWSGRD